MSRGNFSDTLLRVMIEPSLVIRDARGWQSLGNYRREKKALIEEASRLSGQVVEWRDEVVGPMVGSSDAGDFGSVWAPAGDKSRLWAAYRKREGEGYTPPPSAAI